MKRSTHKARADATPETLTLLLRGDAGGGIPARQDASAWEHVLAAARAGGLCGLLHESLTGDSDVAPDDVVEKLAAERARVAAVNRHALSRLEGIATAFAREGVDVMALKGAALLLCLYEDPGLRPMCDVDLLIRPGDAVRADRLLGQLGYDRGKPLLRSDFYPRFHYEAEYLGPGPHPLRLDVHVQPWRPLRYRQTVPVDALWNLRRAVALGDASVGVPGPADMLIHLMCHAAFHGGARLLWLLDIHRFAMSQGGAMEWEQLVRRVRAWKLSHAAQFSIERVESALGRCVPARVADALRSGRVEWRDRLVLWQAPRDRASPWFRTMVDLLCTGGWDSRLGYLRAVLLPDREHMAERYHKRHPGWLGCAYGMRAVLAAARGFRPLVSAGRSHEPRMAGGVLPADE